jgi:hypothetical protein
MLRTIRRFIQDVFADAAIFIIRTVQKPFFWMTRHFKIIPQKLISN